MTTHVGRTTAFAWRTAPWKQEEIRSFPGFFEQFDLFSPGFTNRRPEAERHFRLISIELSCSLIMVWGIMRDAVKISQKCLNIVDLTIIHSLINHKPYVSFCKHSPDLSHSLCCRLSDDSPDGMGDESKWKKNWLKIKGWRFRNLLRASEDKEGNSWYPLKSPTILSEPNRGTPRNN